MRRVLIIVGMIGLGCSGSMNVTTSTTTGSSSGRALGIRYCTGVPQGPTGLPATFPIPAELQVVSPAACEFTTRRSRSCSVEGEHGTWFRDGTHRTLLLSEDGGTAWTHLVSSSGAPIDGAEFQSFFRRELPAQGWTIYEDHEPSERGPSLYAHLQPGCAVIVHYDATSTPNPFVSVQLFRETPIGP